MGCRMICLDIDGTLLNTEHQITDTTRKAIADAITKGALVVLVSARMPQGMEPIRKELALQDILVCYSGALIMENGMVIYNAALPIDEARDTVKTARSLQVHASLYKQEHWIVEKVDAWSEQETAIIGLQPEVKRFSSAVRSWREEGVGPNKLLFMADADKITELKETLDLKPHRGLECYRSKPTYLEAVPSEGSKRRAIAFLCERYGIPREETLAIGDNENDLDMIEYAGIGVAMGNAAESVKKAADFVTNTNDEDGAAFAIRKFS